MAKKISTQHHLNHQTLPNMHHTSNLHNMMLMAKERGRGLEREKSKGRLGQVGRERKRERERCWPNGDDEEELKKGRRNRP